MPNTNIATEIDRLSTARNTIRDKMIEFGLGLSTDKLDTLATEVDGIAYRGAVSATVQEGDTYTIPRGYHNGSGTVSGVAGGGNYNLQSKAATPTKQQQSITPDSGYYGLSDVTVNPIPEAYQNVSSVTATAGDVLAGKVIVTADGTNTTGTMTNRGAVTKVLDATTSNQSYTVPQGYHNGNGTVSIVLETKTATPTKSNQDIVPTTGKVLSKVTVGAIPAAYQDVTDVTASASDVLTGSAFVDSTGAVVDGTMVNNGSVSQTLDATNGKQSYTIPQGYHDGTGNVSITLETKTATPTKATQTVTPTNGKVLSVVTVNPIPSDYQDVTGVTATAPHVLSGDVFVNAAGSEVTGSMTNNGAVSKTLDATTNNQSYTVPTGYHNGSGTVQIVLETKTATPTTATQNITPTSGKVLSKVTVNPIPSNFANTSDATATAANILAGETAYGYNSQTGQAVKLTGSMTNNGAISGTIDGLTTLSYSVPSGYTSGGTVSLTDDIYNSLAAI